MSNPWQQLEILSLRGWSLSVTAHEEEGEPAGIELWAERRILGQPPQRLRVVGPSVAEATPRLLELLERYAAVREGESATNLRHAL